MSVKFEDILFQTMNVKSIFLSPFNIIVLNYGLCISIKCAYRIPLGHHTLFLEARELAPVVDGGDHLPQHQQRQPHQHDGGDHTQHDAQDEHLRQHS